MDSLNLPRNSSSISMFRLNFINIIKIMYHLSSVVVEDIYVPLHGPDRSPGKGTPGSFMKLQPALRQEFCDDQFRTLQDLLIRVDVIALSSPEELDDYRRSLTSRQGMSNIKIMGLQCCFRFNLLIN